MHAWARALPLGLYRGQVLMEDSCEVVLRDERVRDVYLGKQLHADLAGSTT